MPRVKRSCIMPCLIAWYLAIRLSVFSIRLSSVVRILAILRCSGRWWQANVDLLRWSD